MRNNISTIIVPYFPYDVTISFCDSFFLFKLKTGDLIPFLLFPSEESGSLRSKSLKKKKKTENFCLFLFTKNNYKYGNAAAASAAKSLQSCPTLCDPIDGSPPGSPIPGIL